MRATAIKYLAVLLLLGAILSYSTTAEAHRTPTQKYQATYQDHEPPVSVGKGSDATVATALSGSDDDGCLGGCCAMTAYCCPTAAITPSPFEFVPNLVAFEFDFRTKTLAPSLPYTLLRPPQRSV